jgi:hypothetical protein
MRGYGLSLEQRPLTRFAEFISGRRFAPTSREVRKSAISGKGWSSKDQDAITIYRVGPPCADPRQEQLN